MRLKDAVLLLDHDRFSAAYYLSGYAVECGVKDVIALSFRAGVIPDKKFVNDIYSHKLAELIKVAGLKLDLERISSGSNDFAANWAIVSGWTEQTRYEIVDPFKAKEMVEAVSNLETGVLQGLRSYW